MTTVQYTYVFIAIPITLVVALAVCTSFKQKKRDLNTAFAKFVVALFILLLIIPLLTHYISKFDAEETGTLSVDNFGRANGRKDVNVHQNDVLDDFHNALKLKDLTARVKEMVRIRGSVSNELRSLEGKRQQLQSEISSLSARVDELKSLCMKKETDLESIRVSLDQIQYAQKEANLKNQPFMARPVRFLPEETAHSKYSHHPHFPPPSADTFDWKSCSMRTCFDYSRCSLTSGFPVYFYHPSDTDNDDDDNSDFGRENEAARSLHDVTRRPSSRRAAILHAFNSNAHVTFDPTIACIYVVILLEQQFPVHNKSNSITAYLHGLPFWGDGSNHVIINFISDTDILGSGVNPGKALVVQSQFTSISFRHQFDVVLASLHSDALGLQLPLPSHCPSKRKFLATYEGQVKRESAIFTKIVQVLNEMQIKSTGDLFKFDFSATNVSSGDLLLESTYALILPEANDVISSDAISWRLGAILRAGAVPVLLGGDYLKLPYDDAIDWNRAVISLPLQRVTELHFVLKTINDGDLLEMKRHGNFVLQRYLANAQAVVDSSLAVIRQKRLQIAAPPAREEPSLLLFNASNPMRYFDPSESAVSPDSTEPDENLGPLEPPFPTISYQRNYSLTLSQGYSLWNEIWMDPFTTYPYTPFDPILPSEGKFVGSPFGFRPIAGGAGGAGKEFSEGLGGNVPKEQFTIVMLTYEREAVLIDSLQRLKALPHLNKILVVWNSPHKMPSSDLRWPDVGVPIQVVRANRNSLNNRFKPFDEIETEAILSMDDDAHLRHDEIIFGFRVWREARERIVGFPGRFHAWDNINGGWHYNSNYSCELSMVLTGAAFFHKYYTYLYSYAMPALIRDKVDEYVNCEDIAMNFLVSHITRKPPIKVTSRWTFRCPGCPVSLSEDDSHFQERHKCINFFTSVYGYNPLLNTQFRADSVLFKTRIPHDKQKCFKFI